MKFQHKELWFLMNVFAKLDILIIIQIILYAILAIIAGIKNLFILLTKVTLAKQPQQIV